MGLISKTVIMKWNGGNKNYYMSKEYNFTKMGGEFEVKVEDLSKGATVFVKVECDICNKEYTILHSNYLKAINKRMGKLCCQKCNMVELKEKRTIKKIKSGESFEQWCINNNRGDLLSRWDYELNNCLPNEITYGSNLKMWFKCEKGIHDSELKNIKSFTSVKQEKLNCHQCSSVAQWGIDNLGEDFLEKYWSDKNTLNPWKLGHGSDKKIWITYQKENYEISCSYLTRTQNPLENAKRKKYNLNAGQYIIESYGQDFLDKVWSNKNDKSAFEYAYGSHKKVWWRCIDEKHDNYQRSMKESHKAYYRCPNCVRERNESFLQEKVRLYLEKTNYTILHENNCTIVPINPKTKMHLPFDNEIKELKLICEVHGIQHYEITGFHIHSAKDDNTTPEYELHYQQLKDRYKRIKAIQQKYFYLEIPYWTDDKEETWKQLIDNKINEILKQK